LDPTLINSDRQYNTSNYICSYKWYWSNAALGRYFNLRRNWSGGLLHL